MYGSRGSRRQSFLMCDGACIYPMQDHETRPSLSHAMSIVAVATLLALVSGACTQSRSPADKPAKPADVNESRIVHADREPGNWMTHGRNYDERRFSPLNQI